MESKPADDIAPANQARDAADLDHQHLSTPQAIRMRAIDERGIKPVIDAEYPLEELGKALDHLDRGPFGKVVVRVHPTGS